MLKTWSQPHSVRIAGSLSFVIKQDRSCRTTPCAPLFAPRCYRTAGIRNRRLPAFPLAPAKKSLPDSISKKRCNNINGREISRSGTSIRIEPTFDQ